MNPRTITIATVLAVLWCAVAGHAEEVKVVADSAPVKIGDKVIATVKEGEQFAVLERKGPWVAITVKTDQGERRGWVLANKVVSLVDEDAPAPAESTALIPGISLDVQLTQFTGGFSSRPRFVALQLQIGNHTNRTIHYDAADLALEVDGQPIKPGQPDPKAPRTYSAYDRVYTGTVSSQGYQRYQRFQSLSFSYLKDGELAPDNTAVGWVRFQVPRFRYAREVAAKSWILTGTIGGQRLRLDLKQTEIKALGAKVRPATVDPTVQVIEVRSRLNALNVQRVEDMVNSLPADQRGCVLLAKDEQFIFGAVASQQLRSLYQRLRSSQAALVLVVLRPDRRLGIARYPTFELRDVPREDSEAAAVMIVLGGRPDAAATLVKHLTSDSPVVRAAAAKALANHTAQPVAVDALVNAAADKEATVRSAALSALGGIIPPSPGMSSMSYLRPVQPAPSSPQVIETIVKGMADPEVQVRSSAAQAAAKFNNPKIISPLIKLLDDSQAAVAMAACRSLGTLKAQDAVSKLREIQTRQTADAGLKTAAADALKAIGVLSPLETALAKLDGGYPSSEDFDILAKAKDKRAVSKLVAFMKHQTSNYHNVDQAAKVLSQIGDPAAVEPLIQQLTYGQSSSGEVPRALGKLGDKRAIKPLREALQKSHPSSSFRYAVYEALVTLKAPGMLEELTAELEKKRGSSGADQILRVLGSAGDPRAIPQIEPYLDDQRLHSTAALALVNIGTPAALAPIRRRLLSADYQYGRVVMGQLTQKHTAEVAALLREAANSQNHDIRSAAANYLDTVERAIVSEYLNQFHSHLAEKDFDGADKAFQTAIQVQLEMFAARPSGTPFLAGQFPSNISTMLSAYRNIGKSELADAQFEKVLATIEARIEKAPAPQLISLLEEVRGEKLMTLARSDKADEAQRLLDARLAAARKAFAADPDNAVTAIQVVSLLKLQTQLAARVSPEKLAAAQQDDLRFLAEAAQKHPQNVPIVSAYLDEHFRGLSVLARENPDEAEKLLTTLKQFVETLDIDDPSIQSRVKNADRAFESIERYITAGRAKNALLGNSFISLEIDAWVNGTPLSNEDLKGKVVLLDFWAVWCGPCIATFPHLRQWHEKYEKDGLVIIGLTRYYSYGWDAAAARPRRTPEITAEQERAAVVQFAKHHQLKHRLAFMPKDSDLSQRYGVTGIPQAVLIDRQGKIRLIRVGSGEQNAHDIENMIKQLLADKDSD